jgi:Ca-activated chloride channel homolog
MHKISTWLRKPRITITALCASLCAIGLTSVVAFTIEHNTVQAAVPSTPAGLPILRQNPPALGDATGVTAPPPRQKTLPSFPMPRPPVLIWPRAAESNLAPAELKLLRIEANIQGNFAQTTYDITVSNPNSRIMEGELQFPLQDGQDIIGFAMEVNGALRDAMPVDKAKGQEVFEDIIRQRVDPGLLERTQGNNFKLRLYPIPANGTKRAVIRIGQNLQANQNGLARFALPVAIGVAAKQLEVDIKIAGSTVSTLLVNPFSDKQFATTLSYRGTGAAAEAQGTAILDIPVLRSAAATVSTFEGKRYFVADIALNNTVEKTENRAFPKRIGLLWDSSLSAAKRNQAREFSLLDAYFAKIKNTELTLTVFRDAAQSKQNFSVRNGDWLQLRSALEAAPRDGASNLHAVDNAQNVSEYLLFSDGLFNYGAAFNAALPKFNVPVYAVNSASEVDGVVLRQLSERSNIGGRLVDLSKQSAEDALAQLTEKVRTIRDIKINGASEMVLGSNIVSNGNIVVAGVLDDFAAASLNGSKPAISVTLQLDGEAIQTINVPITVDANGDGSARRWAMLRIHNLDGEYQLNRAEIRRLGNKFALASRETSLIVLDTVQDYVRHDITPPLALRKEYDALKAQGQTAALADKRKHIENVMARFNEKVIWWEKSFPKYANKELAELAKRDSSRTATLGIRGLATDAPPAPAALAPPPAPMAPLARATAEARSEISADQSVNAPSISSVQVTGNRIAPQVAAKVTARQQIGDSNGNSANNTPTASIKLKSWQPNAPYAGRLREAEGDAVYRAYLDEAPSYTNSSGFYLDAAEILFEKKQTALALRVLSNLAEMNLENRGLLRILAQRLLQAGQPKLAIPVLRKVLQLAPNEPQSYRDLGLALAADKQYQAAINMLYEVVERPWHNRFPEIELITLADLNGILATANEKLDVSKIDPRFIKNMSLDLRAVLTWDADNTDIDLWITDPLNEKVFYGNRFGRQGGRMSLDFTGGYGPEEFSLREAAPGTYTIQAHYYGSRSQAASGPTTLQVAVTTGFGRATAKQKVITLRLKDRAEQLYVGQIEIGK